MLPTRAVYRPWLLATVAYLAIFAIREPNAPWTFFGSGSNDVAKTLAQAAVLSIFAGLLLWQQLGAWYLTTSSELQPFLRQWAAIALGYPLLGGVLMVLRSDVRISLQPSSIAWDLVATCIAAGQWAFLGAVTTSLIWKTDEPGFAPIRLSRQAALEVLSRRPPLTPGQYRRLLEALNDVHTSAPIVAARAPLATDSDLLFVWKKAATHLYDSIKVLDVSQVDNALLDQLAPQLDELKRNK